MFEKEEYGRLFFDRFYIHHSFYATKLCHHILLYTNLENTDKIYDIKKTMSTYYLLVKLYRRFPRFADVTFEIDFYLVHIEFFYRSYNVNNGSENLFSIPP